MLPSLKYNLWLTVLQFTDPKREGFMEECPDLPGKEKSKRRLQDGGYGNMSIRLRGGEEESTQTPGEGALPGQVR